LVSMWILKKNQISDPAEVMYWINIWGTLQLERQ
jgi:hypothetical protein